MDDKELNHHAAKAAYRGIYNTYQNYRPRALMHAASMGVSTDIFGEAKGLKDVALKYVKAATETARAILEEKGLAAQEEAEESARRAGFDVLLAPENQRYSLGDGVRSAIVVQAFLMAEEQYNNMCR